MTVMALVIAMVIVDLTSDFPAGKFRAVHIDVGPSGTNRFKQFAEFTGIQPLVPCR
jgi:hypothetical protein